jgi:hypothetical protein
MTRLKDLPFLQSVDERDIDFVLLEECHSEPEFVRWFAHKVITDCGDKVEFAGAWHSVSDPRLGESDIVLLVRGRTVKTAILIENKIDAFAQPDQAARYIARGTSGKIDADWEDFITVIVAPAKYLKIDTEASRYDARVSYEEIRDWLQANTPATRRRDFRLNVLNAAIEQNRRGRVRHFDERVADFFRALWELANTEFPELEMRKNDNAAANNTWPRFGPQHLRDAYPRTFFYYKTDAGVVDIEFHGLQKQLAELRRLNEALLTDGVRLVAKGRSSVALSIRVPRMNSSLPFAEQIPQAREALAAARKLSELLKRFRFPAGSDN